MTLQGCKVCFCFSCSLSITNTHTHWEGGEARGQIGEEQKKIISPPIKQWYSCHRRISSLGVSALRQCDFLLSWWEERRVLGQSAEIWFPYLPPAVTCDTGFPESKSWGIISNSAACIRSSCWGFTASAATNPVFSSLSPNDCAYYHLHCF